MIQKLSNFILPYHRVTNIFLPAFSAFLYWWRCSAERNGHPIERVHSNLLQPTGPVASQNNRSTTQAGGRLANMRIGSASPGSSIVLHYQDSLTIKHLSIMKKNFVVTFVLMMSVVYSSFSAGLENPLSKNPKEPAITSLVINADVNIVLFNDGNKPVRMAGDTVFMEQVSFKQTGNTLVVKAIKNKNWKNKGVIYIPANGLTSIQINNDAVVRSSETLVTPKLDIGINGSCKVSVFILGEVNIIKNDSYEIEYEAKRLPLSQPLVWERTDRGKPLAC
jgi:Putative auto-transporter adhesin, head GIN domain